MSIEFSLNENPSQSSVGYRNFERSHPDFVAQVRADQRAFEHRLTRLENLSRRKQRSYVRKVLQHSSSKMACTWHAVMKKQRYDLSPEQISRIADGIDVFAPSFQRVLPRTVTHWRRKSRMVQQYGLRDRARQQLVRRAIQACHPPRKNQFFYEGVPAALKAVEAAIQSGMRYGVELDVISFYPSMDNLDGLSRLLRPIPSNVVSSTVTCIQDRVFEHNPAGDFIRPPSNDRTIIAHGSATSDIVGEVVMSQILAEAPDAEIICYHDNMFVLAQTQSQLSASINAVRDAVAKQHVGSLEVSLKSEWAYPQDITFLGAETETNGTDFAWRLSSQNQRQYHRTLKLKSLDEEDYLGRRRVTGFNAACLHRIYRGLGKTARLFPNWDGAEEWKHNTALQILSRLFFVGFDCYEYQDAIYDHYRWLSKNSDELPEPREVVGWYPEGKPPAYIRDLAEDLEYAYNDWLF